MRKPRRAHFFVSHQTGSQQTGYFPLSIADKGLLIHACKSVSDILIVHHDIAILSSHLNFETFYGLRLAAVLSRSSN